MRFRSLVAVAVCVCAGLAAAGCASQSSSTSGTDAAASATEAASAAASATASTGAAAQASGNCQPAGLKIVLGASTGAAGQQQTLPVYLTNTGSSPCTMKGFPGVNLVGRALGKKDYTWPLERASRSYQLVTLQPAGTAHFDIIYLPGNPGDAGNGNTDLAVTTVVITPPNDYTHAEVSWSQSVLLQDAATHPGTYITPVVPGA